MRPQLSTILIATSLLLVTASAHAQKRGSQLAPGTYSVNIGPKKSAEAGLPKIDIHYSVYHSGLTPKYYPGGNVYLRMSGPPGGPLGLVISHHKQAKATKAQLKKQLAADLGTGKFKLGKLEKVTIGRPQRTYRAIAYATGQANAAAHGCVIALSRHSKKTPGVLIRFWAGAGAKAGKPTCKGLLARHPFDGPAKTLRVALNPK